MSELPAGWTDGKLQDCAKVLDNLRVPVNSDERNKRQGNIPYYGATGQVGCIDDYLFDEELLLIGEDGAPFFDKTKPIAYIIQGKSWVNNHAHVLRAKSGLTSNLYLKYFLDQFDFHEYVNGTTRLKLTQGSMNEIPVKLAPFNEQIRIAEKLEKLLSRVDAAQARLATIPRILKRFRQSVLAAACSGKLTTDWRIENPDVESAEHLFQKILALRSGGIEKTGRNPVLPDGFGDDFGELPQSWKWVTPNYLCDPLRGISYGVIKLGASVIGGVPCLRTSDVKPLRLEVDNVKHISPQISASYARTVLKGNEVLVNVRGTLGGVATVPLSMRGWNVSREVAVVPLLPLIEPRFVAFWIASTQSQNWLKGVAKGVAYTGINLEDLRLLPTALPPLAEQQEIVRRVEASFKTADALEARYQVAKAHVDKLTQSILAKAFRGELVPQDPKDEPASKLLERIRKRSHE